MHLGEGIELKSGILSRIFSGMGDFQAVVSLGFRHKMGGEMVFLRSGLQLRFLAVGMDQPKLKVLHVGIPVGHFFHRTIGKFTVIDFNFLALSYFTLAFSIYVQSVGVAPAERDEQEEDG